MDIGLENYGPTCLSVRSDEPPEELAVGVEALRLDRLEKEESAPEYEPLPPPDLE